MSSQILSLTKALVETPTPTGSEGVLRAFLTDALWQRGFEVQEQPLADGRANLLGKRGNSSLLFSAHVDTFPAYTHPEPYRLKKEGDALIGRGVADCKGQIAALLTALELVDAPCQVAFVVDEERGGIGSRQLDVQAEGIVVLEPTQMQAVTAQAGAIEFEVTVYGKSAHGSAPQFGENAILKAMQLIERIQRLPFLNQSHPLLPPAPWVTLGKIEGGFEPMVVPNQCKFQMDIRILPGTDTHRAVEQIRGAVTEFGGELQILDVAEPMQIEEKSKVVKALGQAYKRVLKKPMPLGGYYSWTDAFNYIQKGIPAVVFGAGSLGDAHSDREWVSLKELEVLTQVFVELLKVWSG